MLTTEAVLMELGLDQDDFHADEPMMSGSDEEFSDLEDVEDEDDNRVCHSPLHPLPRLNLRRPPQPLTQAQARTPSPTLTSVNIPSFDSPVGPKVDIPESPFDTFELLFTRFA